MADLDEHKLRDLEAAIATAIHQALVVGVDPKYIGGLLQEHLDSLSAEVQAAERALVEQDPPDSVNRREVLPTAAPVL
jgi:hypothetical protein